MGVSKRTVRIVLAALDLPDRAAEEIGWQTQAEAALSSDIVNGISTLLPRSVGVLDGIGFVTFLDSGLRWLTLEFRWSDHTVTVQSPIGFERR